MTSAIPVLAEETGIDGPQGRCPPLGGAKDRAILDDPS